MTPSARCPECSRRLVTEQRESGLVYPRHAAGRGRWPREDTAVCLASNWHVEDDELIERQEATA